MAHVILTSLGTDGDINPYVGLGVTLRGRGHRVTLAAAENYRPLAARHELEFRPLITREENSQLLDNPDFWHPLKGPRLGARWGVRLLPRQYELFSELAADPDSIFISNPAILAARLVQEKFARPLATVILQPWMIRSSITPPVMPAYMTLPRWAPWPIPGLYWRMFDFIGVVLMGGPLNELRKQIGLPSVKNIFEWWLSPQRVLCMFSPAYAAPQRDWPPQARLTGFPMFDGCAGAELDPELLEFCRAGEPPVVFTFGTGMMHASKLFRSAAQACQSLGRRAIFLTRHTDQLPQPLPPTVRHVSFAPFRALFPHCGAIVHHGGVGTLSWSLASGKPQLILPIAFDQKDNAIHIEKLGAGEWIKAGRATGHRIAGALRRILSPQALARCQAVAPQFAPGNQLENAAQCVEELAATSRDLATATPPQ